MKVSDLGKRARGYLGHSPYNEMKEDAQNKPNDETFQTNENRGKFKNKPDGFENADLRMRSSVEKGFYAKEKLKELSQAMAGMTSFGRYHE